MTGVLWQPGADVRLSYRNIGCVDAAVGIDVIEIDLGTGDVIARGFGIGARQVGYLSDDDLGIRENGRGA